MLHKIVWSVISLMCLMVTPGTGVIGDVSPAQSRYDELLSSTAGASTLWFPLLTKEVVSFKITVWSQGDLAQAYQDITDEYNALYPYAPVQLVSVEDMDQALSTAIPLGEGPDIVVYATDSIGGWAVKGYLAPVDQWINIDYLDGNFMPPAVEAISWNNQLWGIPDTMQGIALVYNTELISADEIPEPSDWNSLSAAAEQFQEVNPDSYYLCNQGLGNYDAYYAAPIYFGFGLDQFGGYLDEYGSVYITTTQAINAGQWISDFSVNGPITTSVETCQEMMIDGETAIWWTGPWAIPSLQAAGVNYGIASMGSPFVNVRSFMLTTNAVNLGRAEAAINYMTYITSANSQKTMTLANQTIPTNLTAFNDADVQAIYEVDQFGDALALGTPMGNNIYTSCQWQPVADATMDIWEGSMPVEDALLTAWFEMETCMAGISP